MTETRTIERHLKMQPYDRGDRNQVNAALQEVTKLVMPPRFEDLYCKRCDKETMHTLHAYWPELHGNLYLCSCGTSKLVYQDLEE